MWLLLLYLFKIVTAYREESFDVEFVPDDMRVADACTLYTRQEPALTIIRFHHDGSKVNTSIHSKVMAINHDCSMVLFGFPDEEHTNENWSEGTGVVRVWHPGSAPVAVRPAKIDISWIEDAY